MKVTSTIKAYLSNFLQTQLIVTIAAVPILVNWGLSISLMTFVGNLLFSPILTIFLMLSSLVFFTQLLHIPNHLLLVILDWFTRTWANVLDLGSQRWLIEFCRPPTLLLLAIPVATLVILHVGRFKTAGRRIGIMSSILGLSLLGLWGWSVIDHPTPMAGAPATIHLTPTGEQCSASAGPATTKTPIADQESTVAEHQAAVTNAASSNFKFPKNQQLLDIQLEDNGYLTITDHGFFNRRHSPEKTVEFELKPYLIKRFGKIHLKKLVITHPGQRALAAAKALCTLFTVDQVSLPYFKKTLTKGGWRAFFDLKRLLEERKIEFKRYNQVK
jgi:hypothetical protein